MNNLFVHFLVKREWTVLKILCELNHFNLIPITCYFFQTTKYFCCVLTFNFFTTICFWPTFQTCPLFAACEMRPSIISDCFSSLFTCFELAQRHVDLLFFTLLLFFSINKGPIKEWSMQTLKTRKVGIETTPLSHGNWVVEFSTHNPTNEGSNLASDM